MVKLSGAVLGLVGILVMAIAPRTQEDDSKAQIAALQKELKACGAVMQVQERTLKELDRRLKAVEGWFQGVPTALGALDNGLKECESSGFTNAGANPRERPWAHVAATAEVPPGTAGASAVGAREGILAVEAAEPVRVKPRECSGRRRQPVRSRATYPKSTNRGRTAARPDQYVAYMETSKRI